MTRKANDIATVMREVAERDHAQYPQYRGMWDDWTAVKFTKRVRTNRGPVAFEKDDRAIVSPDGMLAYSWRTKNNMEVLPTEYVRPVK